MSSFIDLSGKTFGNLTVIGRSSNDGRRVMWNCKCSCGEMRTVRAYSLTSGHTVSCGCIGSSRLTEHRLKHGQHKSRAHGIWGGMKGRCLNPKHPSFNEYGGRGITICERWLEFENFFADMGHPPRNTSIDRIDNNKGYEPGNCRWATPSEQLNNRRNNVNITFQGKTQTLTEWAEELRINVDTLYARIVRYKWSIEDALTRVVAPHRVQQPCRECGGKHFAKGLCNRCYSRELARLRRSKLKK